MSRSLLTRSISSVSLYEVGSQHQPLLTNLQDRLSLETMLLALQHIMEDLIIQLSLQITEDCYCDFSKCRTNVLLKLIMTSIRISFS
jgi:hypothetical protein